MDEIRIDTDIILTDKEGKEIEIKSYEPEKVELWV